MFGLAKTEEEHLKVAIKMFIMGFFLLPGVWLVMECQFYSFWRKQSATAHKIRTLLFVAAVGAVIQFAAIITWMGVYLSKWQDWGATGDNLNVITYEG